MPSKLWLWTTAAAVGCAISCAEAPQVPPAAEAPPP
ncbi:uncharacterized protein METZ01_LOCUS299131, partial [marine metagenome]